MVPEANGWNEWSRHVLAELERNNDELKELRSALEGIRVEIATLKVKAGVWGAAAGLIPTIAAALFIVLR
jgi:hypothetical protein